MTCAYNTCMHDRCMHECRCWRALGVWPVSEARHGVGRLVAGMLDHSDLHADCVSFLTRVVCRREKYRRMSGAVAIANRCCGAGH